MTSETTTPIVLIEQVRCPWCGSPKLSTYRTMRPTREGRLRYLQCKNPICLQKFKTKTVPPSGIRAPVVRFGS